MVVMLGAPSVTVKVEKLLTLVVLAPRAT